MLHTIFEKQKHPKSQLIPITNGIYAGQWRSTLWPKEGLSVLTDKEIWEIRTKLRTQMLLYVSSVSGVQLDPHALTIVWARRFAGYKRPHILFNDLKRLEAIVSNSKQPVQIIVSGMAHPADTAGVEIVEKIKKYVSDAPFKGKIVYLPRYAIDVARQLVQGADIWINTPTRGVEACGTSGMKAGINGALMCSVSDGWIEEVNWNNIGWVLPEENTEEKVYSVIEESIQPLFYKRNDENVPEEWVKRIRETVHIVGHRFTTERMLKDYIAQLYYPEE